MNRIDLIISQNQLLLKGAQQQAEFTGSFDQNAVGPARRRQPLAPKQQAHITDQSEGGSSCRLN
jgi:hypothetical protein